MKTISKNTIICILASIVFIALSLSMIVNASSTFILSFNNGGTYREYKVTGDSTIYGYITNYGDNTRVYLFSDSPFSCIENTFGASDGFQYQDAYMLYFSYAKASTYSFSNMEYVSAVGGGHENAYNYYRSVHPLEPTEPSTEEPSTESPSTEPSTEEPAPTPTPTPVDSDLPVDDYLTFFIQHAFWYGAELATLLSLVGYGVFKAISLININKNI